MKKLSRPGDSAFVAELYERHAGLMFKMAYGFGLRKEAAEDVVSTAMLRLMRHADTLSSLSPPRLKAYIVTAVRRTAVERVSREALRRRKEREAALDREDASGADGWLKREELDTVLLAIEKLPEKEKACIKLKFLLGKSDEQIALENGISASSVRKYISRGRKHIRKAIGGEGGRNG